MIMSRLIFLRQAHRTLYEITYSITEFYSWPILFAITGCCTRLILSLYYLIMVIMSVKAASVTRYILAFLWVIVFIFPIIPLTGFVTRISTEIKRTGDVVNRIMNKYSTQIKIHYELEQFSIELLHRKLRFTACGLFSLDGGLVTSMTSTMITYMIILVQFKDSILTVPTPTTPPTSTHNMMCT
ncbi:putative gustatory receptor 28a [Chelonus insularis]|uniref:putative gustatory receptor 28a n=1 Tax=Chelonus insularis TaxID=460826 RepID=UPI0015886544|nr:putative gustatory receptor 28a [Chelonus insularis]